MGSSASDGLSASSHLEGASRARGKPASTQRRALARTALYALLPSCLLVAGLLVATWWKGLPFGLVSSDPVTTADLPFYAGLLSNVGVLLWCATSAIAIFVGTMLRTDARHRSMATFLLLSGLFTTMLLADDFFLVHEVVFPYYLGMPQRLLVGSYALLAIAWLAGFARVIARTNFSVLLLSLCFLGISAAVDQFSHLHVAWEDGPKLLGIASWCAYFVQTSFDALHDARRTQ